MLVELTQDLIRELCENPGCAGMVQQRILPTLVSILQANDDKVPGGMQSVAIDMLESIIRTQQAPLTEGIVLVCDLTCFKLCST